MLLGIDINVGLLAELVAIQLGLLGMGLSFLLVGELFVQTSLDRRDS